MELVDDDYLKIISKKLEDLSKKKVLVTSSSLKKVYLHCFLKYGKGSNLNLKIFCKKNTWFNNEN